MLTLEKLAQAAGFTGEALDQTQLDTYHRQALKNFAELLIEQVIDTIEDLELTWAEEGGRTLIIDALDTYKEKLQ